MTARLPARGFWSYARKDDDYSGRRVSQLYDKVHNEVEADYGKTVEIFQDKSGITKGAVWEARIKDAIKGSTFLIPVITPTFLQRPWCFHEVRLFLKREKELQTRHPELRKESLIFPIGYREIRDDEALHPDLMAMLRGRQWLQFEELQHQDLDSPDVRERVSAFARAICALLRLGEQAKPESGGTSGAESSSATSTRRASRAATARIALSLAPAAIEGIKALLDDQQGRLHNHPPEAIAEDGLRALRQLHEALGALIQLAGTEQDLREHVGIVRKLSRRIFSVAADTGELCVAGFKPLLASMPAAWGTWTLLGMICNPATFAALGPAAAVAVSAGYFGLELKSDRADKS